MNTNHPGFTRIDLAACIFLVFVLASLLLPAINQSRGGNSRQQQCTNNVRQLALGCLSYASRYDKLPAGGWGTCWAGDPKLGHGEQQPGGWMYALLPHLEYQAVYDLGLDAKSPEQKAKKLAEAQQTPLPVLYCPNRQRRGDPLPTRTTFFNSGSPENMGKTDYVGNGGDGQTLTTFGNGAGMSDFTDDDWARQPLVEDTPAAREYGTLISNGVFQRRTGVRMDAITDGEAHTYLLGEKYLYPEAYTTGAAVNDDQGWDVGFDADVVAFTRHFSPGGTQLMADLSGYASPLFAFGGVHRLNSNMTVNMAMVSGKVQSVNVKISAEVHAKLGIRNDSEAVTVLKD